MNLSWRAPRARTCPSRLPARTRRAICGVFGRLRCPPPASSSRKDKNRSNYVPTIMAQPHKEACRTAVTLPEYGDSCARACAQRDSSVTENVWKRLETPRRCRHCALDAGFGARPPNLRAERCRFLAGGPGLAPGAQPRPLRHGVDDSPQSGRRNAQNPDSSEQSANRGGAASGGNLKCPPPAPAPKTKGGRGGAPFLENVGPLLCK